MIREGDAGVSAVHRVRADCRALGTLLAVVDRRRAVGRCAKDVRWLRKKAGAVRDIDVSRGMVRSMIPQATKPGRAAVALLDRYLRRRRRAAEKVLLRIARRDRARSLPGRTREALAGEPPDRMVTALNGLIDRLNRRVTHGARDEQALHQIRLAAKAVRDLAELISPVTEPEVSLVAARARALSDRLGACQDLYVLADMIRRAATADGDSSPDLAVLRRRFEARADRSILDARAVLARTRGWARLVQPRVVQLRVVKSDRAGAGPARSAGARGPS